MLSFSGLSAVLAAMVTLFCLFNRCDAFKGLSNQRNFAHVYGKRTLPDTYQNDIGFSENQMYPTRQEQNYDSLATRSNDNSMDIKGKVAHMFGRELYFDDYTPEDIYDLLLADYEDRNLPLEKTALPGVPKVRDGDINTIVNSLPLSGSKLSSGKTLPSGQRLSLSNLLLHGNRDKYADLSRYID